MDWRGYSWRRILIDLEYCELIWSILLDKVDKSWKWIIGQHD